MLVEKNTNKIIQTNYIIIHFTEDILDRVHQLE